MSNSNISSKTGIFRLSKIEDNMSDKDKIACLANNTGNLVFDNTLGSILNGENVYLNTPTEELEQYDRFITTSYIWIRENEPINSMLSKIGDKPFIPMSVGLQSDNYNRDFSLHPSVIRDLKTIAERCIIGCRGNYTAEVLNKNGIRNLMVIGCPSIYKNIFSDWVVEQKESSLLSNTSANFITFWRHLRDYEQSFLRYAYDHNMDFVEQTSFALNKSFIGFDEELKNRIINWTKRGKIFFDYNDWSDYIMNFDFSMGYRFHANAIAVNNHIPALFIYSDSRVKELCDFFKFPSISSKAFDDAKPLEYWYEKADYSEFNKTQAERIENFRTFCHKNMLTLKDEKEEYAVALQKEASKIEINVAQSQLSYECKHPWEKLASIGSLKFSSDGKSIWNHLKLKLPEKMIIGNEYFISIKVRFKTDSSHVRFFLEDSDGNFDKLCSVVNKNDDAYTISTCMTCNHNYFWLEVTNTDFVGENFFELLELDVKKLTVKSEIDNDNTVKEIVYFLGLYAECSQGCGSLFDYFNDKNISGFSLFLKNDYLMKALHAAANEAGLMIHKDISKQRFSCNIGYTSESEDLDELIKNNYHSDYPIIICCDIDEATCKKLKNISPYLIEFWELYKYAVAKNCIIEPAYNYFKEEGIDVKIYNMYITSIRDILTPSDYEKQLLTESGICPADEVFGWDEAYKEKARKTAGPYWYGTGKKMVYLNSTSKDCVFSNGIRKTHYQYGTYKNNIWFIGTSVSSGAGYVIDEHTIESYLQNILNEKCGSDYMVHNVVMPSGWHYGSFISTLKRLPIKDKDIVIFSDDYSLLFVSKYYYTDTVKSMTQIIDTREYFQRPHDMGEVFIDRRHVGPLGCKRYAEAIFNELFVKKMAADNDSESTMNQT